MKKGIMKFLSVLTVCALALSVFVTLGASTPVSAAKKVRINKTELDLMTGEKAKLKLKNGKFAVEDIEWTSSDKAVAKVSSKGKVLGLVRGKCTVTAKVKATGETYKCKVTVTAPDTTTRVIDPEKKIIALTFDDGPGANTESLLETLEQYGVTATFFMCYYNGSGINRYGADIVRKVYNSGNEVANHTQNHPQLNKCTKEKMDEEVNGNAKKIRDIIGSAVRLLLRPPYGAGTSSETLKQVANVPFILWSVDTLDWKYKSNSNCTELIMKELKNQASDGGIILMHDIHKTSCEAAKTVIPWLIEQGYQVCSVSEMFAARGVELKAGETYSKCISAEKYKELNSKK